MKKGDVAHKVMTNKHFAEQDEVFRMACSIANIKPTTRQASKYRVKRGLAYAEKDNAKHRLVAEKK